MKFIVATFIHKYDNLAHIYGPFNSEEEAWKWVDSMDFRKIYQLDELDRLYYSVFELEEPTSVPKQEPIVYFDVYGVE